MFVWPARKCSNVRPRMLVIWHLMNNTLHKIVPCDGLSCALIGCSSLSLSEMHHEWTYPSTTWGGTVNLMIIWQRVPCVLVLAVGLDDACSFKMRVTHTPDCQCKTCKLHSALASINPLRAWAEDAPARIPTNFPHEGATAEDPRMNMRSPPFAPMWIIMRSSKWYNHLWSRYHCGIDGNEGERTAKRDDRSVFVVRVIYGWTCLCFRLSVSDPPQNS